jgi:enoyl-CoA hydratase
MDRFARNQPANEPTNREKTMPYENILAETRDRVGLIRLNRPQQLNALNAQLMEELSTALEAFDRDDDVGCMVIAGNERAFAAGADIKEMTGATAVAMLTRDAIGRWDRIRKIKKPVIAAVSGWCLGGGCELAMSCDIIVASETAQFGQPEINIGVMPGAGGTQRLTRAIGKSKAMEMVLTGRYLSAREAEQAGLVSRVVPAEVILDEALKLGQAIASKAPIAVRLAKEAVNKTYELSLSDGLDFERRLFYLLFATDDQKEGMQAFIDKRPAEWKGK